MYTHVVLNKATLNHKQCVRPYPYSFVIGAIYIYIFFAREASPRLFAGGASAHQWRSGYTPRGLPDRCRAPTGESDPMRESDR